MKSPHRVSTLLYCFNPPGEVLLMERAQEPNIGLWSPPGGKLDLLSGESPHQCAAREAREELQIPAAPGDFRLTGLITEVGHSGHAHWLMFLFEFTKTLAALPQPHREGRFQFFGRSRLESLQVPAADREMLWPLFWKHRGGFFAARCETSPRGNNWTLEEEKTCG